MYRIGKSRKAEEVPRLPPLIGRGYYPIIAEVPSRVMFRDSASL